MATLETPSRILRRIDEASLVEMPSLPSFPINESEDGPGDPMYPSVTASESEERERSITSFPTDPTESEEPATRVTSTPLVTSAFRTSGSRFASGGSRHISGSQSRFINSLHTTLLPNGERREDSYRASPIGSSMASTVKLGGNKSSYGSKSEVENGRGQRAETEGVSFAGEVEAAGDGEQSGIQMGSQGEESVKSDELHEAQDSFVSSSVPHVQEYEEYQVSVHSAPMPSPRDPLKNINMRRKSSMAAVRRATPVLSVESFSNLSDEEQSQLERSKSKLEEITNMSHDITLPQDTPRSIRDTSHMKRAFSSSPAAAVPEAEQVKSTSISRLPPLPESSPMDSHFTTVTSIPRTPLAASSHSATSRRASYVLSVLSSAKTRLKTTPHPYRAPIRRTPHPLIRVSLERRASFASATTSTPSTNNDLTTNLKANTSFDPAIGETRFNVAKMNGYLHKLNEKLVEENLGLHLALKEYESSSNSTHSGSEPMKLPSVPSESIREESVSQAEEWHYVVASLREELDAAHNERERLEDEVKGLTLGSARKETEWEAKLRSMERDLQQARIDSQEWEEKARQEANEKVAAQAKHDQEVKLAEEGIDAIVKELEGRITARDREIQSLKEKLEDAASSETEQVKALQARLEAERMDRDHEKEESAERVKGLQSTIDGLKRAMTSSDTVANQASAEVDRLLATVEQLRSLQPRLDEAEATVADQRILLANKETELDELRATVSDLSEELSACHDTIQELEASLKDREEELELAQRLQPDAPSHLPTPPETVSSDEHDAEVAALQDQLDEAHRELGKLKYQLTSSPTKDAVVDAVKADNEKLKKEVAHLQEALGLLSAMDTGKMQTPARKNIPVELTPSAVHKSIQALKITATPGSPLKDISWLQNTTFSAAHVAPLLQEIQRLRDEVAAKEQRVDDELDGLQDAFGRNNGMLRRLQDEIDRRQQLQLEVNEFTRRDHVLVRRLAVLKCVKCKKRFDASDVLDIPVGEVDTSIDQLEMSLNMEATQSSEVHKAAIAQLNDELRTLKADMSVERRQWKKAQRDTDEDKHRAKRELEAAEAERSRVRAELKTMKETQQNDRATMQADLNDARSTIAQLRAEIRAEREEIRALTEEQARMHREKGSLNRQLDQKQADLDKIRNSLEDAKKTNTDLQAALQAKGASERQTRANLERLRENEDAIHELRQERDRLLSGQYELQQGLDAAQDHLERLHHERAEREALADRYRLELDNMAEELQAAGQEREHLHEDGLEVQRMIRELESDLRRLRREADRFGRDLSDLQAEKDRVEAKRTEEKAQSDRQRQRSATEVRLVKEQLTAAQSEARRWETAYSEHVCGADPKEIEALRIQHKKECKGLVVQIQYVKEMYKRENVFRLDLSYQKRYLQGVLAQSTKLPIAKMPALLAGVHRVERPISLRSAAKAVIFMSRLKRCSEQWRAQRAHRPNMYAALDDARRRRTST